MPDDQNERLQRELAVNRKIRERIQKKDFLLSVESAVRIVRTEFGSPDVKRIYLRFFDYMALQVHIISVIGRASLPNDVIEKIEAALENQIDAGKKYFDDKLPAVHKLFEANALKPEYSYLAPLTAEVRVTSPLMRKYLDQLVSANQFFGLLETLYIEGIVKSSHCLNEKTAGKKVLRQVPGETRRWAVDVRKMVDKIAQQTSSGGRARRGDNAQPANGADRVAEVQSPASSEEDAGKNGELQRTTKRGGSGTPAPTDLAPSLPQ